MKCENCQTDNSESAERCSQCDVLLNEALHKELELVSDLIRTLSARDKGKTSVSRLMSQNLKRKDQILKMLSGPDESEKTKSLSIEHVVDVNVPTAELGKVEEITSVGQQDIASEITVKMDMLEEEESSSSLPGTKTDVNLDIEPIDISSNVTKPIKMPTPPMPPTRVMQVEEVELSEGRGQVDRELDVEPGAATVKFSADEEGLLTEEELRKLGGDARNILELGDDTVAVSADEMKQSLNEYNDDSRSKGARALLKDIRRGKKRRPVSKPAKVKAPSKTPKPTLDLSFHPQALLYPAIVIASVALSKALLFTGFIVSVNPQSDATPLPGILLFVLAVAMLGFSFMGRMKFPEAMVDALRLGGVFVMASAFAGLAQHHVLSWSISGATATGLVIGGLAGMSSVTDKGWTHAAATLVFAVSMALMLVLLPDMETLYIQFPTAVLVATLLAGVAAGLSFQDPRLGWSVGLGLSGTLAWLSFVLLTLWVGLKDWQIDVDTALILKSLFVLIVGFLFSSWASRRGYPVYGAAILGMVLLVALLRKGGVSYPQLPSYIAVLSTGYLFLAFTLWSGKLAEYSIPLFIVGGYFAVLALASIPVFSSMGSMGILDFLLPVVLPGSFGLFLFLRRNYA